MVIERFLRGPAPVYERLAARGRLLPDGLRYIDSWVAADLSRCFQVMETDEPALLETWMDAWRDLVAFEVTAVLTSSQAAQRSSNAADASPGATQQGQPRGSVSDHRAAP